MDKGQDRKKTTRKGRQDLFDMNYLMYIILVTFDSKCESSCMLLYRYRSGKTSRTPRWILSVWFLGQLVIHVYIALSE